MSRPCFFNSGDTCAILNFAGNVACSKDRLASLATMCANELRQDLIKDVGRTSRGDDFAGIDPSSFPTQTNTSAINDDCM